MAYIHKNILGSEGRLSIIRPKVPTTGPSFTTLETLVISNTHNSLSCVLDLYLFRRPTTTTTEQFYIIKNLTIFKGTSVTFDSTDIGYDNTLYDLYLNLNSKLYTVDLKLKTT